MGRDHLRLSVQITIVNLRTLDQVIMEHRSFIPICYGTDSNAEEMKACTCCNSSNLPWFCKTFPTPITEDLEVRICTDEEIDSENVAIEFFELYIQGKTYNVTFWQLYNLKIYVEISPLPL